MSDNPFESPRAPVAAPPPAAVEPAAIDFGGVFRRSFEILTVSPPQTAGIAVAWLGLSVGQRFLGQPETLTEVYTKQWPVILLSSLTSLLLLAWIIGLAEGRPLGAQMRRSLPRLPLAVAAFVVVYLGLVAGMIFLVLPGLYVAAMWAFVLPLVLDDRAGFVEAFSESQRITQGRRWKLLLYFCVPGVVALAMAGVTMWVTPGFGDIGAEPPLWTLALNLPVALWQLSFFVALYQAVLATTPTVE